MLPFSEKFRKVVPGRQWNGLFQGEKYGENRDSNWKMMVLRFKRNNLGSKRKQKKPGSLLSFQGNLIEKKKKNPKTGLVQPPRVNPLPSKAHSKPQVCTSRSRPWRQWSSKKQPFQHPPRCGHEGWETGKNLRRQSCEHKGSLCRIEPLPP